MKKLFSKEQLRYRFDCIMSKGTVAMSILLFSVTAIIVCVIGLAAYLVAGEGSVTYQIWTSLMHTMDVGTLADTRVDNIPYIFLMFLATLSGMFITSILIGIVANGVESKLSSLRKGLSTVQEEKHTVIIGFDNNIFSILKELIEANSNKKDACVVILGSQPKEKMEDDIAAHLSQTGKTRIICRNGNVHDVCSLNRCAIEKCGSVIVNTQDDAQTVKIILAVSAYLKDKKLLCPDMRIVASVDNAQYMESAKIAGEGRAEVVYSKEAIARVIANTCRQHGLSQVLTELFNFTGNEFYYERVPQLAGKTFKEALLSFSNAIAVGLYSENEVKLNPDMNTLIGENDKIILLERDDGDYKYHPKKTADLSKICDLRNDAAVKSHHLVILGSNDKLPIILAEYNKYADPETRVVIVDDDLNEAFLGNYENLEITSCKNKVTRELLLEVSEKYADNILLLNDDSLDSESSDTQTLLNLILLRDVADKTKRNFAITTEMRSAENQKLASQARVDDFVIGSNYASLLMAQISENPALTNLIYDLLDENGSELYMKPAVNYVNPGETVDSYILTESAAQKGEIYLGYRHMREANVVVNPDKEKKVVFKEGDQVIVVAES